MIDRPATTEGGDRGDLLRCLVLAATALTVRLVYLLESRSTNPFFHAPVVDAQSYLELAQAIVAGSWIGGDAAYWQPPAFPYLLAVVLWLTGDGVFVAIRVLHALLGTASVLLVYHLGRQCLDRRGATLAAAGTALYGPLLYFEGELLSVALEVVLYLALLAALRRAVAGSDVVLHGLNLPYPDWDPGMIELTERVPDAVEEAGATLLFPGNLYGLGADFSAPLAEDAPRDTPAPRKGAVRNKLEDAIEARTRRGLRAIVLRAGDFFGGVGEAWMYHLTDSARKGGAIQYGGSLDVPHSWAYLPDLGRTFVRLAERRDALEPMAVFHFEGHVVDGHGFVDAVRAALGDPSRRVRSFPWMWLHLARPFVPMVRELFEMRYLWDQPVRMDGSKLRGLLGDALPHTPFSEAVATTLRS